MITGEAIPAVMKGIFLHIGEAIGVNEYDEQMFESGHPKTSRLATHVIEPGRYQVERRLRPINKMQDPYLLIKGTLRGLPEFAWKHHPKVKIEE